MKNFPLDPILIKWGLVLLFLGARFLWKTARKSAKNNPPPPPQSGPLPTMNATQLKAPPTNSRQPTSSTESPWSDLK